VTQIADTALAERLSAILPGPVSVAGGNLTYAGGTVPVTEGVVRFRQDSGYNATFALQWNRFRTEQLDDVNGTEENHDPLP
jgi:hypothetical protein